MGREEYVGEGGGEERGGRRGEEERGEDRGEGGEKRRGREEGCRIEARMLTSVVPESIQLLQ